MVFKAAGLEGFTPGSLFTLHVPTCHPHAFISRRYGVAENPRSEEMPLISKITWAVNTKAKGRNLDSTQREEVRFAEKVGCSVVSEICRKTSTGHHECGSYRFYGHTRK